MQKNIVVSTLSPLISVARVDLDPVTGPSRSGWMASETAKAFRTDGSDSRVSSRGRLIVYFMYS